MSSCRLLLFDHTSVWSFLQRCQPLPSAFAVFPHFSSKVRNAVNMLACREPPLFLRDSPPTPNRRGGPECEPSGCCTVSARQQAGLLWQVLAGHDLKPARRHLCCKAKPSPLNSEFTVHAVTAVAFVMPMLFVAAASAQQSVIYSHSHGSRTCPCCLTAGPAHQSTALFRQPLLELLWCPVWYCCPCASITHVQMGMSTICMRCVKPSTPEALTGNPKIMMNPPPGSLRCANCIV